MQHVQDITHNHESHLTAPLENSSSSDNKQKTTYVILNVYIVSPEKENATSDRQGQERGRNTR